MEGIATHVGFGWDGRSGASGIKYDGHAPLAAHKTLPFGTIVKVINNNKKSPFFGKSIAVMIIDRGPYGRGRVIDMMPEALWAITKRKAGGERVKLEILNTRYACNTYMCLKKNLKTNRVSEELLLKLLSK